MFDRRTTLGSPGFKLAAFGVVLALALGGGALAGATFGPAASTELDPTDHEAADVAASPASVDEQLPAGLAVSRAGYTLDLRTPVIDGGAPAELAVVIEGPDGRAVTDYDVEHDKELHLVVVSRDLARYAHVHPIRDDAGEWTVTVPALDPGSYRVFADFTPAGGDGLTLGADLTVPGDHVPAPLPAPSSDATVDGFDVSFDGELLAGTDSELTVTVTRGGEPITDLQPHLGALGHLVAIRDSDLAYLHVHPLGETDGPGGPQVRFAVEVPTAGSYRLFFDFSHGDDVRTAAVTAEARAADASSSARDVSPGDDDATDADHG